MLKKSLIALAAAYALFAVTSCNKDLEYNSNSGNNGSRDSASQLLVNTDKVDDVSAQEADNEDWFYVTPNEKGFLNVKLYVDKPSDIILTITTMDGFGRTLNSIKTNHSESVYAFPEFEVAAERYFISIITTEGKSSYTLRADFRLPDPEPDCEIGSFTCEGNILKECKKTGFVTVETCGGDTPSCDAENGECKAAGSSHSKCVPANKCKPGQKCCKSSNSNNSGDGISDTDKTIKGTIVLVTPRGSEADVKISGIGGKNGVKKGAKAYLRGLKRKVDIYDCKTTYCMATIKATSEELTHYDTVDVVVE